MRALLAWLSGAVFAGALACTACVAPGCDSGPSELEKPPDTTKQVNPMTDMPGFKEQQEKLKAEGKLPKK